MSIQTKITIKEGNSIFNATINSEGNQVKIAVFKKGEKLPLFGTIMSISNRFSDITDWIEQGIKRHTPIPTEQRKQKVTAKEIDLNQAETDQLTDELYARIYEPKSRVKIESFVKMCLTDDFGIELPNTSSLIDKMKFDYFIENFDKISLSQLEQLA